MNKKMHRLPLSILCFAVLLTNLPTRAAAADDVPITAERLRKLETLQTGEARKLDKVVGDVSWLLDDLASNGLLDQGDGEKVKAFKVVVDTVAGTRLPAAAGHLRDARLERAASRQHMSLADEEVDAILEQLKKILAGSSAILAEKQLVRELKDLIRTQTQVRGQTAEWGKAMLISPETAGAGKGLLIQGQTNIRSRYQTFIEKLQQAGKDAVDEATRSRLGQAERVLNPPAPTNEEFKKILTPEPSTGDVLKAAIDQIERSEVLSAVGAQDRAIASLKAALEVLSSGEFELAEFVAGLEKLIEKQKILRKDTDAEEDLETKRSYYEARQIEIRDEVTDYSFDAPDLFVSKEGEYLVEPLMMTLETAVGALKAAEKDKALAAQDKVIALLESVYGTATEALKEEEKEAYWVKSPEIPEDMFKLPEDGEKEDDALADPNMPDIFEPGVSSELFLMPKGTTEGAMPDATPIAANRFLGFDEEAEAPEMVSDEGPPSVGTDKAPDAPGGKGEGDTSAVEKGRLARDSIQRRRQKARIQDYVRQLPPEFRRQVADYYEVIGQ